MADKMQGPRSISMRNMAGKALKHAKRTWRLSTSRPIALDKILCGGEHGMDGLQFSRHTDDATRTSTQVAHSPHSRLLRQYIEIGERLFDAGTFEQTDYYTNAVRCIDMFGRYFNAKDAGGILPIARNLVALYRGAEIRKGQASHAFSRPNDPIIVYPIQHSDCYQLSDGNHRVAVACARGYKRIRAYVRNRPQTTTLQQYLLDVSWNVNRRELYQPISSPELSQWRLVRKCSDRLEMMMRHLTPLRLEEGSTYLDIACNYGWFVKEMRDAGYDAYGIEIDKFARKIGVLKYGLPVSSLLAGEATIFLRETSSRYDIVSCLSLLHHFVLGGDPGLATELLRHLDRLTKRVLFIELGDADEAWFRRRMPGWTPAHIHDWLRENTTFSSIVALGKDSDRAPPYAGNYGRTLFACTR
ncbi:methyltransferase domain-containing protein [Cognatiluteimonas weifangensis]|uniref:Methyltransferase domain-containing protein n=1 Tax=Cognatiluteimonas weifangensis TaxID=2303539 RepID=A0A372DSH7_9GAMM|nr:methyltransferase domain-containing protein [Luteimonas weifangensis]RFP62536.1 methyltransferase domain-containing protein [Luteimonas weifangensis]